MTKVSSVVVERVSRALRAAERKNDRSARPYAALWDEMSEALRDEYREEVREVLQAGVDAGLITVVDE